MTIACRTAFPLISSFSFSSRESKIEEADEPIDAAFRANRGGDRSFQPRDPWRSVALALSQLLQSFPDPMDGYYLVGPIVDVHWGGGVGIPSDRRGRVGRAKSIRRKISIGFLSDTGLGM